jgi:DNA repair protein RadD
MTNDRSALPARGMPFKLLLARAPVRLIREIVDETLVALLNLLDPSLVEETKLRQLVQETADAASLLAGVKTRTRLIEALPAAKARELAILLGVDPDPLPSIFGRLARDLACREDLAPLYTFFGVVPDERAVRRRRTSGDAIEPAYPLFDYQRLAAAKVIRSLEREPRRVLLHMPTGAGKTRTAMHIVCDHLRQHGPTLVTWLAATPELLDQASDEFERAWGTLGDRSVSLFKAWGSQNADLAAARDGVLVAGFQKLHALNARNPNKILALGDRTTLTVVDEAHQAIAPTYKSVIEALATKHPRGRLLGLSATPGRTWANIDEDARLSDFFGGRKVTLEIKGYEDPERL